jgi:hypothetical protein
VNVVHKGNSLSGPFRPRPVREAFSRRANHQFTLVVLITVKEIKRASIKLKRQENKKKGEIDKTACISF